MENKNKEYEDSIDIAIDATDILIDATLNTAVAHEDLQKAITAETDAHNQATNEATNQNQKFDYAGYNQELTEGYLLKVQQNIDLQKQISEEQRYDDESKSLRLKFIKETNQQLPLLKSLSESLKQQIKESDSFIARGAFKLLETGIEGLSSSLEKLSSKSEVLKSVGSVAKTGSSMVKAVTGTARDAKNTAIANKREKIVEDYDQRAKQEKTDLFGGIPQVFDNKKLKPESKFSRPYALSNDKKLSDINANLAQTNEHLKDIKTRLLLSSMMKLAGGGIGGLLKGITSSIRVGFAGLGIKKVLEGLGGIDIERPKSKPNPIGSTSKDNSKPNSKDNSKPNSKPNSKDNSKPNSKPNNKAPKSSSKGLIQRIKGIGRKAIQSGGMKVLGRLSAGLAIGATGVAASPLVALGLAGMTAFELASYFGVNDVIIKEVEKAFAGENSNRENDQPNKIQKPVTRFSMAQPVNDQPNHKKLENLDNSITQNKEQKEQQKTALIANTTSAAAINNNVNTNVSNNATNHYGSSFNFDGSKYQTNYDKGTIVQR